MFTLPRVELGWLPQKLRGRNRAGSVFFVLLWKLALEYQKRKPGEAGVDAKIISWKETRGTARLPPFPLPRELAEGHLISEVEKKGNGAQLV